MYERINRGAQQYQFEVQIGGRRDHDPEARKGVLSLHDAIRFVRSLQSPRDREVLRRLGIAVPGVGSRRGHGDGDSGDELRMVVQMLERGRLQIRVLERRAFGGKQQPKDVEERPPPAPVDLYTVAIELLDVEGNPVPFEPFRIKLPDGRVRTSALDKFGRARITGIREPGTCLVCFHERDKSNWSPTKPDAAPVPKAKPEPVSNPPEVEDEPAPAAEAETEEPAAADEDCAKGTCSKPEHKDPRIDWHFIHELEGSVLKANVPNAANSKSGATVGSGFDLGARNVSDLQGLGLPQQLITKFTPYLGKQGMAAKTFLDQNPLTITAAEAELVNEAAKKQATNGLIAAYNKASKLEFGCLDPKWQTVIASVSFQYGSLAKAAPNFWKQVTTQDWTKAEANLRNFGDAYVTRRTKEANYVKGAG